MCLLIVVGGLMVLNGNLWGLILLIPGLIGYFSNSNEELSDEDLEKIKPKFKVQLRQNEELSLPVLGFHFKGLIPVRRPTNVGIIISLFDKNPEKSESYFGDGTLPVLSVVPDLQDPDSTVFRWSAELVFRNVGAGCDDWIELCAIPPMFLQTPYSGERTLECTIIMYDLDNPPQLVLGSIMDNSNGSVFWASSKTVRVETIAVGYLEKKEVRLKAQRLTVFLLMAVSFSDGEFESSEGELIKTWIQKCLSLHSEESDSYNETKRTLNEAMKESYQLGMANNIDLETICSEIKELDLQAETYEAMNLCYQVMAADGVADPNELAILNKIATFLEISDEDLSQIRDEIFANKNLKVAELEQEDNLEALLGINSTWDDKKVKRHLRKEFQKWNNRINMLEGEEREEAQRMLDLIAKARSKYDT